MYICQTTLKDSAHLNLTFLGPENNNDDGNSNIYYNNNKTNNIIKSYYSKVPPSHELVIPSRTMADVLHHSLYHQPGLESLWTYQKDIQMYLGR